MHLSSVSSQMKARARLGREQVAEAAHSHGGSVNGKVMGRAGALIQTFLPSHLKAPLPPAVAATTFLP